LSRTFRPYLRAIDLLGFPSYREGLPNVVAEAAALEVPTVGYQVTGVRDVVEDGMTGALVSAHDREAFAEAVLRYLVDPALRRAHGAAARARAVERFAQSHIWRIRAEAYVEWLSWRGLPLPSRLAHA
jgi:glycosyltransferase involved in cell wall biosynthesis